MKKVRYMASLIAAVAVTCGFGACSDDDAAGAGASVVNVLVESDPDNALRYPVSVTTSGDCQVSVTYWEKTAPEKSRTTRAVNTSASVAHTMITFVKADTNYEFAVNINGSRQAGEYAFHTSTLPPGVPVYNVTVENQGAPADGYILQWQATNPGYITFCDMDAKVVWYEKFDQAIRMAHYDVEQQKMCVLTGFRDGVNSQNFQRLCDKIITLDLEGNRQVQWIASDENVPYPHHDIKFTPSGELIMVNNFIQKFDLTEFDLGSDTDVWGDGFSIITIDGQVIRTWDNFGELTPLNLGDSFSANGATMTLGVTKDFLHANSVNWDSNGDYYMTFNRINQLWKIDGRTGEVLYRVGPGGNVAIDESGYASGLHAAEPIAPDKVLCYDNGSNRGFSRAVIYEIDPVAMTAQVTMSVPIPSEYSSTDRSNVQLVNDGSMLMFGNTLGRSNVFTDLSGNILKVITRTGISYRSYYYESL